jgi:hypothetical protein
MATASASPAPTEETGHDPVSAKLVATDVNELVVGRKLWYRIYGENEESLLAEGITITAEFSRRLKERAIRCVNVHSDDVAQATFRPPQEAPAKGLELDAAIAERIDTIIDDDLLGRRLTCSA